MTHPEEPPWAVAPPKDSQWSLTEIKQGVTMAHHSLQRPCTYLGRAHDTVHIPVAHASCSRVHARLAFDATHTLWLRDLGSTHGTFCNQRKLPAQACGEQESTRTTPGARGIRVRPGDVLQLGASTRMYWIEGPWQGSREPKVGSVGMEQPPREDVPAQPEQQTQTRIPETYQKEFEHVQALQYKISNMQQESERIRRKGDLTLGQEKQLQRNEQRTKELQEKINDKQEELDRKRTEASQIVKKNQGLLPNAAIDVHQEEEEEVEDRTQRQWTDDNELNPDGETENSLRWKWDAVQADLTSVLEQLTQVEMKLVKLQQRVEQWKEDEDEIFFLQNDMQMEQEHKKELLTKQKELEGRIMELEQLLTIVNPRIRLRDQRDFMNKRDDEETSSVPMLPLPGDAQVEGLWISPSTSSMPPRPEINATTMPPPEFTTMQTEPSTSVVLPRPDKRPRVKGPVMSPPPTALIAQPRPVTLDAIPSFSEPTNTVVKNSSAADVWRPPKDQDGSGRSKLNDKFGGRY